MLICILTQKINYKGEKYGLLLRLLR